MNVSVPADHGWLRHQVPDEHWYDWRWQLANRLTDPAGLLPYLREPTAIDIGAIAEAASRFRFAVVPYVLDQVCFDDASDPWLLQLLPTMSELDGDACEAEDPYGECHDATRRGIVHRYPDRLLLMVNDDCAMFCRHCTRRHTLSHCHTGVQRASARLESALEYLQSHPCIREVLLSGGDPLLLDDVVLAEWLEAVCSVSHVEVIRIGTRVPVTLPMRINRALTALLKQFQPLWVNTQFNHPRELTEEAVDACGRLVDAGIPVSNQSVLLKGLNDSPAIMRELCAGLQRVRVRPYYVFMCDPVRGTSHWQVPCAQAVEIENHLRQTLGGLCVPRFVVDRPGALSKEPIQ